jgi:hypothetical protein
VPGCECKSRERIVRDVDLKACVGQDVPDSPCELGIVVDVENR